MLRQIKLTLPDRYEFAALYFLLAPFRLPFAWVVCAAMAEVGKIYRCFGHCHRITHSHLLLDAYDRQRGVYGQRVDEIRVGLLVVCNGLATAVNSDAAIVLVGAFAGGYLACHPISKGGFNPH